MDQQRRYIICPGCKRMIGDDKMNTIRTTSGIIYDSDYVSVIENPDRLYIRIINSSLQNIAITFGNKEELSTIYYEDLCFAGYTKLIALVPEGEAIRVVLTKE